MQVTPGLDSPDPTYFDASLTQESRLVSDCPEVGSYEDTRGGDSLQSEDLVREKYYMRSDLFDTDKTTR